MNATNIAAAIDLLHPLERERLSRLVADCITTRDLVDELYARHHFDDDGGMIAAKCSIIAGEEERLRELVKPTTPATEATP